jgi:hypothetical protein
MRHGTTAHRAQENSNMHRFHDLFRSFVNFAPDDGTGGGGGAGDGGEGDGGGAGMDDATRDLIIRTTNAAVANQLGRKLGPAISEGVTAAMAPLQESIAALSSSPGDGGKGKGKGNESPEMAELIRKQKALEGQLAEERTARQTQETAARDAAKRSQVQNALAAAGVEPLRMKGAMAEIMGNVHQGDDGSVFFRDTSKGYDDDLALGDGVTRWSSTDVGKSYMAPKNIQGSGATPPGRSGGRPPGNRPQDPKAAKAQAKAEARQALRGQVAEMIGGGAGVNLGGGHQGGGE